jgi:hypothetical protein
MEGASEMKTPMIAFGAAMALASAAFANVGVFNGSGQTPIVEKTDAVQMVEEEVVMTPRKASGPVTTSCRNLDPMDYRCTFKLRNLKDEPVELQVGFPLDIESWRMPHGDADDMDSLPGKFGFSARCGEEKFAVRFVPEDKEERFSNLFLWTMKFAAREERTLSVSYTMEGYLGLYPTALDARFAHKNDGTDVDRLLNGLFGTGIGEAHMYVTGTGSCWAGEIEKAVFKYYSQDFEAHLVQRGAYDETESERKERLSALKKKGASAKGLLKPDCRMVRSWNPSPDKWARVDDGKGRFHYELSHSPFHPTAGDSIVLGYVAPPMPTEPADVDIVDELVCKFAKSRGGDEERLLRDAKDVVLEFYGEKTDNKRIAAFVSSQCWGAERCPSALSGELRKRLQKQEKSK